jgi:hypothetical protein
MFDNFQRNGYPEILGQTGMIGGRNFDLNEKV